MRLRNKKTGKIVVIDSFEIKTPLMQTEIESLEELNDLIKELNEEWEDYEPKESLIKDESDPERAEKIRKAVRMWAEALHIDRDNIKVSIGSHRTSIVGWQPGLIGGYSIDFPNILNELHDGMQTTITELCGEKQECES